MSVTQLAPANGQANAISEYFLNCSIWLMLAVSFVVFVEPAPVDLVFAFVLIFFARSRHSSAIGILPMLLLLLIYNVSGFLSFLQAPQQPKAMTFVVTSTYMAVTAVVFALYVSANPIRHFRVISVGWIVGALFASIWGLIDFFQLPSPFALQVLEGRATGLFKDPNVFSTYLICPIIVMMQTLVLRQSRYPVALTLTLLVCILALFLSFSRGAWMSLVVASFLMLGLTFVLSGDQRLRTRLILFSIGGLIISALLFMFLMSIPQIQTMFLERFALVQYYDAGETGRFGNQLRSLPDLATHPFGYGPLVFRTIYGQDPHNTFLNAFASYGWFGGITYFILTISTIVVGFKAIVTRTPWQPIAIAIFAPLVSTILQGVQIDTEHWRHFYWMLGSMWGIYAATAQHRLASGNAHLTARAFLPLHAIPMER
jgi:O-Antigen ligase